MAYPKITFSNDQSSNLNYSKLSMPEKSPNGDCNSNDSLLEHEADPQSPFSNWHDTSIRKQLWVIISSTMMIIGVASLGSAIWLHAKPGSGIFEQVSYYSPVIQHVDTSYHDVRFNGTLAHPSPYRGDPSPTVDAAWDKYEDILDFTISKEELLRSGSDIDSIRVEDALGGGYLVSLEVTHQLHCLNFLRKALYYNWDYYQFRAIEFQDSPEMVKIHIGHCLEMIRQNLVCNADVGIISHRWVQNYPRPYPNFNTMHKCRNFESVMEFAVDSQLQRPEGYVFKPLEGDRIWESAP